jgi:hypothetical protein
MDTTPQRFSKAATEGDSEPGEESVTNNRCEFADHRHVSSVFIRSRYKKDELAISFCTMYERLLSSAILYTG